MIIYFSIFIYEENKKKLNNLQENVNEEESLLNFMKNKFKLLIKDTNVIQKIMKDLTLNKTEPNNNLMEIFFYVIKHFFKTNKKINKSETLYVLLCHLTLTIKMNEYWILFIFPKFFPSYISNGTNQNEIKMRNALNEFFLNKDIHSKEDFFCLLECERIQNTSILKISYPLNLVICETILLAIVEFESFNVKIFNDLEIYLNMVIRYSKTMLDIDEKTIYYILNCLIYDRMIKPHLTNHSVINPTLLSDYLNFLGKMIKIRSNQEENLDFLRDNQNKIILEAIRYQKSQNIFERMTRIIIDYNQCFSNKEENYEVLIATLLFISFEAQ